MTTISATYSPEDNKLRLYASSRLDAETYARVKAAGFKWAAKQDLFVAPMWTPAREDLALELAGEIDDEDTSLVDRAAMRSERFETYSDKRANEAKRERDAVSALADGIPLGQPILVGHHSERRARKDAQRIENGMRKAVNLWETSQYWQMRAAGALAAAKYKDLPGVRARRIKTLEAEKRKVEREKSHALAIIKLWENDAAAIKAKDGRELSFLERALYITNCHDHLSASFPLAEYPRELPASQYEGSMSLWSALSDGIITPEQAAALSIPAHERIIPSCDRWLAHYDNRIAYEKAMLDEQGASNLLEKPKKPAPLPLCNYRAPEGIDIENMYNRGQIVHYPQVEMAKDEYAAICNDYKGTRVVDNSHRVRTAMRKHSLVCVFLTDSKTHDRPAPIEKAKPAPRPAITHAPRPEPTDEEKAFAALKQAAKAGPVEVVAVPQLFPTPHHIAEQMIQAADIKEGHTILEPSAGTGNLLHAIPCGNVTAVELNHGLASRLRDNFPHVTVKQGDFLGFNGDLGNFDRIVMNPPFENGADIKHITHALGMLKPGGVLVALCANGPRQADALKPKADTWEPLPPGSFKEQGTGVNVALLTIRKPKAANKLKTMAHRVIMQASLI